MKVTVFNGSPRGRKSNSHLIVGPLLEGARQAGAQTEEVFLIEKQIGHCRGCFTCWTKTPGKCAIRDDMSGLIELLLESNYAGLATPVYSMYMTGLLKDFYDRLLPLATPQIHRNDDGTFYHEGRVRRFPRLFFLFNSGFPGEHNFELLRAFVGLVKRGGADSVVLELYRDCGEVLGISDEDRPGLGQRLGQFREALRRAGWEIVTEGRVSNETMEQLHMKLMTDEEYVSGANKHWDQAAADRQ
jgi:hypothetical protein